MKSKKDQLESKPSNKLKLDSFTTCRKCVIDGCSASLDDSMIKCGICMRWAHSACANEYSHDEAWNCKSCRRIPDDMSMCLKNILSLTSVVSKLSDKLDMALSKVDSLQTVIRHQSNDIKALQVTNDGLAAQLLTTNAKCEELLKSNSSLSNKINEISGNKPLENNLLIGTSIIKHIKPTQKSSLSVECIPGARIENIKQSLETNNQKYDNTYLVVGSIDVSLPDATSEGVVDKFRELINQAFRVSSNVTISSILPRSDKPNLQKIIDECNKKLADICHNNTNCNFIDSDGTFKLANGSPNASLLSDGHHLSECGCRQLVKNLGLPAYVTPVKQKYSDVINGITYKTRSQQGRPVSRPSYRGDKVEHTRNIHSLNKIQQVSSHQASSTCWFCGERGHVASSCRHGDYIQCFECYGYGHKRNNCTYFKNDSNFSR